jgi:cell division protein FtsB
MLADAAKKYGLIALALALLFVVCLSENGIVEYFRLKSRIHTVDASIKRLQGENVALRAEIDRLRNDDRYLEDVARKKFGLIREGEKVYRIEK